MAENILLSHGGGGEETWDLISGLFLKYFSNPILNSTEDAAVLEFSGQSSKLAFTTDSFTVSPPFFKGGNIGKLAIAGTVNDLAVMGARPLYLSSGFIIEEGFSFQLLEEIVKSMAEETEKTGVKIVTGDTKVVPKGHVDKIFINTSGIGQIVYEGLSASNLEVGHKIIISGTIGDHGACIMASREGIKMDIDIESDCRCMWDVIKQVIESGANVYAMRDPTRGGLAGVLNEWASKSGVWIELMEDTIPIKSSVTGLTEILGLDPMQFACEGKIIFAVSSDDADKVLNILINQPACQDAAIIGEVVKKIEKGKVVMRTPYNTRRIIEPPAGELLPRIC